jgi:Raf kinase inhibitor-like YbhB/YbcL family protein
MQLTSASFQPGEAIPARFTCEGEDISPEFSWKDAPKETKSFVLVLHDPDAPKANGFTHWIIYNIPPGTSRIEENIPKQNIVMTGLGMQGRNDGGKIGYTGPCPPSGTHRYFARLYALRKELDLQPGVSGEKVKEAMGGNIIEETELMGTYTRQERKTA